MIYGLYQSAAGLQAQDYRQTLLANNLANVDTPGFKPDRVTFQERLVRSLAQNDAAGRHDVLDALPGGLFETRVYTDYAPAGLETGGGPLDTAILGDGFLRVHTADGDRVTRDGRMVMDESGRLLHAASGGEMLDVQGRGIVLNRNDGGAIRIDDTGRVFQGERLAGRLAVVDFADRSALTKSGENLFDAGGARFATATGRVQQRAVESSGTEPTQTLVEMIEASRAYQINATLLSLQDESLGRAVSELGRIG